MPQPVLIPEDYRQLARRRLSKLAFDYVDGGAEDELTLLGSAMQSPLVVAPTGLNGMLWHDGDIALARAAARAGVPFVLSTAASATIEEVAEQAGGNLWFQLYTVNRGMADSLVERALRGAARPRDPVRTGRARRRWRLRRAAIIKIRNRPRADPDRLQRHQRSFCLLH